MRLQPMVLTLAVYLPDRVKPVPTNTTVTPPNTPEAKPLFVLQGQHYEFDEMEAIEYQ